MDTLLANHERKYCEGRCAKFFQTKFGEVVVTSPLDSPLSVRTSEFSKHFDMDGVRVYKNRGMSKTEFETVFNSVLIEPESANIKGSDWRGEIAICWK